MRGDEVGWCQAPGRRIKIVSEFVNLSYHTGLVFPVHPPHAGMTGIALKSMQRLRKKFAQIGSTRERSLEEGPTCGAAAAAASSGASAAATDE